MNIRRSPYGVVVNELDCDIVINEFELQSFHHFRINILGKYYKLNSIATAFYRMMDSGLNNPGSLTCHKTKKTDLTQIYVAN